MRNSLPPLDSCGLLLRYRLKQPLKSWVSVGCRVSNLMFYGAVSIKIFGICSSLVTVLVSEACFGCTVATERHCLSQMLAASQLHFEHGSQGEAMQERQLRVVENSF